MDVPVKDGTAVGLGPLVIGLVLKGGEFMGARYLGNLRGG